MRARLCMAVGGVVKRIRAGETDLHLPALEFQRLAC
jgi:hypothetical protein